MPRYKHCDSKHREWKSAILTLVKRKKQREGVKVRAKKPQIASWRDMDTYVNEHGYQLVEAKDLSGEAAGNTFYVRVDKYADEGGRDCSVLWRATYKRSERNANTGTLEHLFDYTCTRTHLVYPQHRASFDYFPGNRLSTRDSDVAVYKKEQVVQEEVEEEEKVEEDGSACGCALPQCYFCFCGSDI